MTDTGMLIDVQGALIQLVRFKGHGHQSRFVAQASGVEDGAELAQHVLLFQVGQPIYYLAFVDAHLIAQFQVGTVDERKFALNYVKQLPVG
jgi:hypothetical protein